MKVGSVRKLPMLSAFEIAIARASGATWISHDVPTFQTDVFEADVVYLWNKKPKKHVCSDGRVIFAGECCYVKGSLPASVFPSIAPGEYAHVPAKRPPASPKDPGGFSFSG